MTKYPLLIEPIIKTTKGEEDSLVSFSLPCILHAIQDYEWLSHMTLLDLEFLSFADNRGDIEALEQALALTREILKFVNSQVDAHEKKQRLIDIYHKMEVRSFGILKGNKFRVSCF